MTFAGALTQATSPGLVCEPVVCARRADRARKSSRLLISVFNEDARLSESVMGRLTLEMCAIAQVDYEGTYRTQTILFSHQIPQTGLIPNRSDDTEYVPTRHIFSQ